MRGKETERKCADDCARHGGTLLSSESTDRTDRTRLSLCRDEKHRARRIPYNYLPYCIGFVSLTLRVIQIYAKCYKRRVLDEPFLSKNVCHVAVSESRECLKATPPDGSCQQFTGTHETHQIVWPREIVKTVDDMNDGERGPQSFCIVGCVLHHRGASLGQRDRRDGGSGVILVGCRSLIRSQEQNRFPE
jgi:hypothetical protein